MLLWNKTPDHPQMLLTIINVRSDFHPSHGWNDVFQIPRDYALMYEIPPLNIGMLRCEVCEGSSLLVGLCSCS